MERRCAACDDDVRFLALTRRERDVMTYVAMGKPNKIIAAELGVSQRTVEAHRARIFQKMQVRNAVELANRLMSPGRFPDARFSRRM